MGAYTPPLVDYVDSNKPLSIALEEISEEKIVPQYGSDARALAEELLSAEPTEDADADADDDDEVEAEVVMLDPEA